MNIIDLDRDVGGYERVVRWEITHHLMMVFEIDSAAVEAVMPDEIDPLEVLPGRALLSVAALRYAPDNFGPRTPPFSEIVTIIGTSPDLSLPMPMPRFTFFDLNVYSDSPDFVEGERRYVGTPTELCPSLKVRFSTDGLEAEVSDTRGPIAEMRNTSADPPGFKLTTFWGQHFNDTRGFMVVGPWHWEGELWEHQKPGSWGKLYPHPFFKGLDLTRIRRCYMQLFARPGSRIIERFYEIKVPGGDKLVAEAEAGV